MVSNGNGKKGQDKYIVVIFGLILDWFNLSECVQPLFFGWHVWLTFFDQFSRVIDRSKKN